MSSDLVKICVRCGREIEYRRKWARDWDNVRYCGERCRRASPRTDDRARILKLLSERSAGKTICPSEILPAEQKTNTARMEEVRQAARLLAHEGQIEITQKGRVVDPAHIRGPIRLRLRPR